MNANEATVLAILAHRATDRPAAYKSSGLTDTEIAQTTTQLLEHGLIVTSKRNGTRITPAGRDALWNWALNDGPNQ
jgi:ribosomal protein S19E (S16A)